ncbi:hypothetical protein [Yersinia intermedia]|uniref:hypothetical protein n=1 Tax=Yersinia intermedia TaxID=631 RepID=UPI0005DCE9A4|nr:hypothetical protein [Yersinia intermedia]CNH55927.1 Uncharacterised protein [Yersinia intermedia]
MSNYTIPSFEEIALTIGKFILVCGEIEFEITASYPAFRGKQLSATWMSDSFSNKIGKLQAALDVSIPKHKAYHDLLDKLSAYRDLRNHLSHGFVAIDATSPTPGTYTSIKIGTSNTSYQVSDLKKELKDLITLQQALNTANAEALSAKNLGHLL